MSNQEDGGSWGTTVAWWDAARAKKDRLPARFEILHIAGVDRHVRVPVGLIKSPYDFDDDFDYEEE